MNKNQLLEIAKREEIQVDEKSTKKDILRRLLSYEIFFDGKEIFRIRGIQDLIKNVSPTKKLTGFQWEYYPMVTLHRRNGCRRSVFYSWK